MKNISLDFKEGIKDGLPICLGYFSVSMAFGLTVTESGLPIWAAVLMSLSNLTSAGQFAGANILIEHGSLIELAITTLIINLRYFLMSIAVSQKLDQNFNTPKRLIASFGITDEVFAVAVRRIKELSFIYMVGLIITPVLGWTLGTLTGAIASSLLPKSVASAIGIALYGMFIAIVIPPVKASKNVLFAVILTIIISSIITYTNLLSGGWAIIVIALLVSAISAYLFPLKEEGDA